MRPNVRLQRRPHSSTTRGHHVTIKMATAPQRPVHFAPFAQQHTKQDIALRSKIATVPQCQPLCDQNSPRTTFSSSECGRYALWHCPCTVKKAKANYTTLTKTNGSVNRYFFQTDLSVDSQISRFPERPATPPCQNCVSLLEDNSTQRGWFRPQNKPSRLNRAKQSRYSHELIT